MIAREQPDLVVLSLPNQLHYERTMEVIAAGVPLVVEKPLAFDLTEAAEMVQAASDRQLFFAIDLTIGMRNRLPGRKQPSRPGRSATSCLPPGGLAEKA